MFINFKPIAGPSYVFKRFFSWRNLRGAWLGRVLLAGLGCGFGVSPVTAGEAPISPDAFTVDVAKKFQKAMPDAKVQITGLLTLEIKTAAGGSQADLRAVFSACLRNAASCDSLVATHVAQMSVAFEQGDESVEQSALRVVVRPSVYVITIRRNLMGKAEPVAAPLQGDFWIIAVADRPTTISMLDSRGTRP